MEEELIDKLREIKSKRELEIYLSGNEEDTNIFDKHFVVDVEYLDDITLSNSDNVDVTKGVFKITEQSVNKNGEIIFVERYYTEDFEFLGGDNKSDLRRYIMPGSEFANDERIFEELNYKLPKKGKSLKEIEQSQLEEIAKTLGIEEHEIKAMSEIDLVKVIEEKEEAKGTEEKEKEEKEINQDEMKQITNQKQEIKLETKVDDKRTLGQVLDLNTSEFLKVGIVYSDRLNEITNSEGKINNTLYSFVAIRKDGTAMDISDRLQVDEKTGNDQNKDSIKIDADEQARMDNKTRTRFKIIGENGKNVGKPDYEKETLSVENSQYGEIKAYYGKGRSRYTNENIEIQLETSSVKPTTRELRSLQADRKGIYNTTNMVEEANETLENRENVSMYDVDGDEYTVVDGVDVLLEKHKEEWTQLVMEDPDVDDIFTSKEVEEMIENYWLNEYSQKAKLDDEKISGEKEVENIVNEIKQKIVEDAKNIKEAQGRKR